MATQAQNNISANTSPRSAQETETVTQDDLADLPAPVRRYLTYTGVVGKPWIHTARVRYTGKFRMAAEKPWIPIDVDQVYTLNPPGFWWNAQFKFAGLPIMTGSDIYKAGHSRMLGKVAGLFTVVEGSGEEVDQGTMVRYLQEMMWFPTGYLGANITWEAVDDHAANVTLHDSGRTATARMYFDDNGRLLTFIAQRYGEFDGQYAIRTWTTPVTDYAELSGLKLPAGGRGVWQLPTGDLPYIEVRPIEIIYNQPIEDF